MVNLLLFLVIAIATFAPPPLRGFVILGCCIAAIWYTVVHNSPRQETPELPPETDPDVSSAEALIEKHAVEQTPKNQKIEK
ncbi:hypothetical protein D3C80_829570 [compost metagenome]|jgi:cytoskeletal protein RodZ